MPDLFVAPSVKKDMPTDGKMSPITSPGLEKEPVVPVSPLVKKHRVPFFTALCENPEGIHFANQRDDEKVVLFLRRHFITNQKWITIALVLSTLPLLFELIQQNLTFSLLPIPSPLMTSMLLLYYLFITIYAYLHFINWFYNVGIITTRQAIDIDYTGISNRDVSAATFDAIQDVRYTQTGLLKSFLNFGDVFIQIDAAQSTIEFLSVPKPDLVSNTIISLRKGFRE